MADPAQTLKDMKPSKEFFIGIDSDGCAFDSMEIKHKECFCPMFIKHWGLQAVSKYAREVWEFVNLYSQTRGGNRWPSLIRALDLTAERKEVKARKVTPPKLPKVRAWMEKETKLGDPALEAMIKETNDEELKKALEWSRAVNRQIKDIVYDVPPFPFVRESLQKAGKRADLLVVSQTPLEALVREWKEHKIDGLVRAIAGQEQGTKTEHIQFAAKGKYPPEKILMIGDAPGDLKAAKANGALFFPVVPGKEEASWERFDKEALDRFFAGTYAGAYADSLMVEFEKSLPKEPGWKK
jgi:phosphoglycolate phosphatase-like HAD superfamily hydrolase